MSIPRDTLGNAIPRPVPSGCVDSTPQTLWEVLWHTDPSGQMQMPTDPRKHEKGIGFWKAYYTDEKTTLPDTFWRRYAQLYPSGRHPQDKTPTKYVSKDEWDDSKHGYWRVGDGSLQFRHPNGTIYCKASGADAF